MNSVFKLCITNKQEICEYMNGCILLIPFLLIRFTLLLNLDKGASKRAAHFPLMKGNEVIAYWIYQFSNIFIFIYLFFLTVTINLTWTSIAGAIIYLIGIGLCTVSIINFASPLVNGLNSNGIYRLSRNPMYLSYFLIFIGCSLLTRSLVLYVGVLLFQITTHWIILSEERWCIEKFGNPYIQYMKKVRRYI